MRLLLTVHDAEERDRALRNGGLVVRGCADGWLVEVEARPNDASGYQLADGAVICRDQGPESAAVTDEASFALCRRLRRENQVLRAAVDELKHWRELAVVDPLTGLYNRRYFDARLAEEVARVRRNPAQRFALLLLDVDDLKGVNDARGHQAGDRLLEQIAAALRRWTRAQDVCCRIGGDEFAVISPNAGPREARMLGARLRLAPAKIGAGPVGIAIGTAVAGVDGTGGAGLFLVADAALYRDKARRRGAQAHRGQVETLAASGGFSPASGTNPASGGR